MNTEYGTLYIVATPIGNLGDITIRALETLKNADIVAAEDTRQTGKLLNHFEIRKPMISYFEHNKAQRGPQIIEKLKQGLNVALVSDAGTPGISDPGADIVKEAISEEIKVTMVPGPVAGIMAVVLSGLDTSSFIFQGFLPEEKKKRKAILEEFRTQTRTVIFYESPHRIETTLKEISEILGGGRRLALCRELTKMYEEIVLKSVDEHLSDFSAKPPRGEYVMVMEGVDSQTLSEMNQAEWAEISVKDHVDSYINTGMDRKAAIKKVALERRSSRNEIYNKYELEKSVDK
ncbi:MAG: 16S rRNA (cytidine(1402)-2'-O)-methyltransferase [Ruminococcaceae bacterium]|nr:16S rRNA (cytidine(1402)-2'-O)-methyltransferase [Oscillospiraceae bacterium]